MCGIAGIINSAISGQPLNKTVLVKMAESISHRGPDGSGAQMLNEGSGFAHTRLSIIDLDVRSKQPFVSNDGNFTITFNGEIFNYLELREELKQQGHSFRTESDTEVLLNSYIEWGESCVQKFNGMWAFAIFDASRNQFFCSRDRFGIKPFVYAVDRDRIYFASEAKAITSVAPVFKKPNYDAISILLRGSMTGCNPDTCFTGIHRLPPAHNLIVNNGQISTKKYWDYPTELLNISFEEACEQFSSLLSDSIKIRLRSDVPVGISLSGGLDSSLITSLSHENEATGISTYTAYFKDYPHLDETAKSTKLSTALNYEPHKVPFHKKEVVENIQNAVFHLETPHHSPAIMPYWNITRYAKRNIKVLLEGQGADELLGGYLKTTTLYAINDDFRHGRLIEMSKRLKLGFSGQLGFTGSRFAMELCRGMVPQLHDIYRRIQGDEQIYVGELKGGPARLPAQKPFHQSDSINRVLYRQHKTGLLNLLHYGDAISMSQGIEARLPFLDYRLVEFVFRLPGNFKLRNGLGKAVLRESARKSLPSYILDDPRKLGFVTPIAEWFREDPSIAMDVLMAKECRERGVFDCKRIEKQIARHVKGEKDFSNKIYRWLMTEFWFREFIDK